MSYENPIMPQGGHSTNAFFDSYNKTKAGFDQQEAIRKQEEARRKQLQQQYTQRMQEMQYKVDMKQVEILQTLDAIEPASGLDNEVTGILRERIDVASQAQLYLMTDFSDPKKRQEAKQVIADYQKLLNLTTGFASSWDEITEYWGNQKAGLNQTIALQGEGEEMVENQWLINAMSGNMPSANIKLTYDDQANDLMLVVSGKDANGNDMKTRKISAKAWMELDQTEENDFIQDIPQLYQEFSKQLGPDNLNLLTANGGINPDLILSENTEQIQDVTKSGKNQTTTSSTVTRTTYDFAKEGQGPWASMLKQANNMIAGEMDLGYNGMKNFFEFNLGMLDNKESLVGGTYADFIKLMENPTDEIKQAFNLQDGATVKQNQIAVMQKLMIDQTVSSMGLTAVEGSQGQYYKDSKTVDSSVTAPVKSSGNGNNNQTLIKNNALAKNINEAIMNNSIDMLNMVNGIKIERVPGSSNRYQITGKPTAAGSTADLGELYIPAGDVYSQGAKELKRILGLPEQYNLTPEGYTSPVTFSNAADDIMSYLIPLTDDSGVDNIDALRVNFGGDDISFEELKEKIPGLDIYNHGDVFSSKITVKLPLQKDGKSYEKTFTMPLSEQDKQELSQYLTKAIIKFN